MFDTAMVDKRSEFIIERCQKKNIRSPALTVVAQRTRIISSKERTSG